MCENKKVKKNNMKTLSFFNIYYNYKHDHYFGHSNNKLKKGIIYGKFTRNLRTN